MKTEICIIGSGPAGSVLAVALAKNGYQVTVVECGHATPDYTLDRFIDRVDVSGQIDLRFGFSHQIGGASNLWAGRLTPLEEYDFLPRQNADVEGWPITWKDIEPYYRSASEIVGLTHVGEFEDKIEWPVHLPKLADAEIKKFMWAEKAFNAGDYLCEQIKNFPNICLLSQTRATKIVRDEANEKIVRCIELVSEIDGSRKSIQADVFIVAAGGIETPRLLLNSAIGGDCVGRFFSTHPKADMAVLKLKKRVSLDHPLFIDQHLGKGMVRAGVGFSKAFMMQSGGLNHYVQLSPMVEYKASKIFETLKGSSLMTSKFIDKSNLLKGFLPSLGLFVYELIGRIAGWQKKTSMFMLRGFLDQYPHPDNRIMISEKKDRFGTPLVDLVWKFTNRDKQSVVGFFKNLDQRLKESGVGEIEYSAMTDMDDWPLTGVHSHFMGTTRMGTSPQMSVTDPDARVHGMENLYVAGPSLFSTYGYANPVYTIVALSLRLADHISMCLKAK